MSLIATFCTNLLSYFVPISYAFKNSLHVFFVAEIALSVVFWIFIKSLQVTIFFYKSVMMASCMRFGDSLPAPVQGLVIDFHFRHVPVIFIIDRHRQAEQGLHYILFMAPLSPLFSFTFMGWETVAKWPIFAGSFDFEALDRQPSGTLMYLLDTLYL